MYYDLHTHTCRSDGTLTARELLARAKAGGVRVIAITDHDDVSGLADARQAAEEIAICLIPGVEVSVTWRGQTVHVVGLGIDATDARLLAGLERLRVEREERARKIAHKLDRHAIPDAYEGAARYASGPILSRTHFARFLADNGHARDLRAAFKAFLGVGARAYVSAQWAELAEAVEWIQGAGGSAVIAHPARYKLSSGGMRRLLDAFKACGGAGIEVVSGSHGRDDVVRFAALANAYDFAASAGSDYHGPEQAWIELGRLPPLPSGCSPIWERVPHLSGEFDGNGAVL